MTSVSCCRQRCLLQHFIGLDRAFRLEYLLSRRTGTHIRVPFVEAWHALARVSWGLAPVLVFILFQVSLRRRVGFTFVPALLCRHLHVALGLAFAFACRRRLDSCSPFCGDALAIHSLFCGGASCTCLPSCNNLPTSCLVTPCAQGTNAPGLAAVALAASPAGLTLEVPLARAGAAPNNP